jgi:uncharacterized membrane-anchored protein
MRPGVKAAVRASAGQVLMGKAPQATLMFWLVKICATTVGETGGDAVSMTLKFGYLIASALFLAVFVAALIAQLRAWRYRPQIYWTTVIATTTAGTALSDFSDRTMHLGYVWSSAILLLMVVAVLLTWRLASGRIASDEISGRQDEVFYWLTILVSNTLGTALGDFAADGTGLGLGFAKGALLFGALIAIIAMLQILRVLPQTVLFWAAYVLTRPLGATFGDTLTKPHAAGGLGLGRLSASFVIITILILLIAATPSLRLAPTDAKG